MPERIPKDIQTLVTRLDDVLEETEALKEQINKGIAKRRAGDKSIPQPLGPTKPAKPR